MPVSLDVFPSGPMQEYAALRQQIRSGDILLCSGNHPLSKVIQRVSESVWSHVAFVIRLDEIDRVMVLESVESHGVRTIPLSHYMSNYNGSGKPYNGGLAIARHRDFAEHATPENFKKFSQAAVDLFSYPYDREEVLRITVRIAAEHLGFSNEEKKALRQDNEYICSEYVYACFEALNLNIDYNHGGFVTPADFAKTEEIDLLGVLKKP